MEHCTYTHARAMDCGDTKRLRRCHVTATPPKRTAQDNMQRERTCCRLRRSLCKHACPSRCCSCQAPRWGDTWANKHSRQHGRQLAHHEDTAATGGDHGCNVQHAVRQQVLQRRSWAMRHVSKAAAAHTNRVNLAEGKNGRP